VPFGRHDVSKITTGAEDGRILSKVDFHGPGRALPVNFLARFVTIGSFMQSHDIFRRPPPKG
jgi:hypothetical protein